MRHKYCRLQKWAKLYDHKSFLDLCTLHILDSYVPVMRFMINAIPILSLKSDFLDYETRKYTIREQWKKRRKCDARDRENIRKLGLFFTPRHQNFQDMMWKRKKKLRTYNYSVAIAFEKKKSLLSQITTFTKDEFYPQSVLLFPISRSDSRAI